jgi:MSHA pilin protein MshD
MKPLNQTKMERFSSELSRSHAPRGNAATSPAHSADKNLSSVFCPLMKQLAIRLGWQTTPAKSLVMSSERGLSLIELIMFIVIVSVAVAGMMLSMNAITGYGADPLIRKQALTVAESLLEEIESQSFVSVSNAAGRQNFNDVMDYNGYATSGIYPANGGAAISGLENYNVAVAVSGVGLGGGLSSASAVQITVTVNNLIASQVVEAVGYRVAY